jgi:hypothetical protein
MPIINEDILAQALSKFDLLKLVSKIDNKKKVIEKWTKAIENRNIVQFKETQIQADFLNDIFGNVLCYQADLQHDKINLWKEKKTTISARKPDASLGFFDIPKKFSNVVAVIELKEYGSSLDDKQKSRKEELRPWEQLFLYCPQNGYSCKWAILSDFNEIRLYKSDYAGEFEVFYITNLLKSDEQLIKFFFFLHKTMLISEKGKSEIEKLIEIQRENLQTGNEMELYKHSSKNTIQPIIEMNIIDTIHQALNKYKGINFINPELIADIFPFNTGEEKVFHYNSWSYAIQSTNIEVYKFFSSIRIENNEVSLSDKLCDQNAQIKIKEIIRILNKSLIYRFQGYENIEIVEKYLNRPNIIAPSLKHQLGDYENQLKTFDILLKNEESNADVVEMHLNFQFDKILNKIKVSEGKPDFYTFEIGYACGLLAFDDYKKSFIIYKAISDVQNRQTTESKVHYFLSQLNLKYIFNLISGHYWLEDREEILSEIQQIDLDKTFSELDFLEIETRDAIREIKENKLFKNSNDKISEHYENVKKVHELYENGGTQHGPCYPNIQWNEFVLAYTNFTSNYILYEIFSEFAGLYQTMFDSFLVSYATDENYNEKLDKFDYYHIICALLYLSPDKTEKTLKSLDLRTITIEDADKEKLTLTILNFLRCNHEHEEEAMFGGVMEKKQFTSYLLSNFSFRHTYYRIFKNIFLLTSKISLSNENIKEIFKSLIKFIKVDSGLGWTEYRYLAKWIKSLNNTALQGLLPDLLETIIGNVIKNNVKNIGSSIFKVISEKILSQNNTNEFAKPSLISKILIFLSDNNHLAYEEADILISLWQISNSENKEEIKLKVLKILSNRFEPIIYTKLVQGGLIKYDYDNFFEKYIDNYINYQSPWVEERKKRKYLHDYSFNYFVEFIFSQNINIKGEQLRKFTKLEDYYYWLLNYEEYDYKNFNPEWILFWRTDTYMQRFSKIKEIGVRIRKFLRHNYNEELAKIYFKYFDEK